MGVPHGYEAGRLIRQQLGGQRVDQPSRRVDRDIAACEDTSGCGAGQRTERLPQHAPDTERRTHTAEVRPREGAPHDHASRRPGARAQRESPPSESRLLAESLADREVDRGDRARDEVDQRSGACSPRPQDEDHDRCAPPHGARPPHVQLDRRGEPQEEEHRSETQREVRFQHGESGRRARRALPGCSAGAALPACPAATDRGLGNVPGERGQAPSHQIESRPHTNGRTGRDVRG